MATATLSYNLNDLIGEDFDPRRTKVWITANVPLIVVDGTTVRLDNAPSQSPASDGTGSFSLVTTNSAANPTSFAYVFHVDYALKGRQGNREQWHSSEFTFTASANIAAISEAFDGLAIAPTWQSEFLAEVEAIRDAQLLLSGISTPDGVVEALIKGTAGAGPLTRAALADTIEGEALSPTGSVLAKSKEIFGGQIPRPQRPPVVTVEKAFPTESNRVNLLWIEDEGATLYGIGYDGGFMKSIDGGKTWTRRAYLNWGPGFQGVFMKTPTGALLTMDLNRDIRRSDDDGATWTVRHTARANTLPLGAQSWDIDVDLGYLYYGEYNSGAFPEDRVILWRSTNDGITWTEFASWTTATGDPNRVSHIHAVQYDHLASRMMICVGDSTAKTGLYRVNAARTGVEPYLTNDMLPAGMVDAPRAIGIMPFQDYMVWGSDSTANPWIFRMARSEVGKANPVVERLYRLNSTAWFTCRAAEDGSRWILSASQESSTTRIDRQVHLYAVEDQGATIYEVGSLAVADDSLPAGSLQPVGLAHIHGNRFTLATRGVGRSAMWQCRLAYGGANLPWPEPLPPTATQITVSSGQVSIPANGWVNFGATVVPSIGRRLCIFETGVTQFTGTAGSLRVDVHRKLDPATTFVHRGLVASERQSMHLEMAGPIATYVETGGVELEFIVRNVSGVAATGVAMVTYGFSTV